MVRMCEVMVWRAVSRGRFVGVWYSGSVLGILFAMVKAR